MTASPRRRRPPPAGIDLRTENEAARRALFALVVRDNFRRKRLDPPDACLERIRAAGLAPGHRRLLLGGVEAHLQVTPEEEESPE